MHLVCWQHQGARRPEALMVSSLHAAAVIFAVVVGANWSLAVDQPKGVPTVDLSADIAEMEKPKAPLVSHRVEVRLVGQFRDGRGSASALFVAGNLAYLATSEGWLEIIDVSDPVNPQMLGSCAGLGIVTDVFVSGNRAYVTRWIAPRPPGMREWLAIFGYVTGLTAPKPLQMKESLAIVDVNNPSSPTLCGVCEFPYPVIGERVHVSNNYVGPMIDGAFPGNGIGVCISGSGSDYYTITNNIIAENVTSNLVNNSSGAPHKFDSENVKDRDP